AACQPFKAVPMEGAAAGEGVLRVVMREWNVAHFWMDETMQQFALHHSATAHTRPNGEVQKGGKPLRSAPAPFAQGRSVHVGIKLDRHWQGRTQRTDHVRASPAGFWCGQDAPIGGGGRVRVQRAKARDAQPGKGPQRLGLFLKKGK